uniref:Mariner Mos1 transposase n=1 Tax=Heterorhabditis bacteriophora TaxID=37862 RepID=A0A1I7XJV2_HETBA
MLLLRNKNNPFLDCIVTCDEKWILYDNQRLSAQWLDQDEASKYFSKLKLHQKKGMVTVWSASRFIHYNFLNPGKTMTAEMYCYEIDKMHQELQRLRPILVNGKASIHLHDNVRPYVSE